MIIWKFYLSSYNLEQLRLQMHLWILFHYDTVIPLSFYRAFESCCIHVLYWTRTFIALLYSEDKKSIAMVLYSEGICCPFLSNPSLIIAWLRLDLYSCLFFCIKRRIYRNKHNNQTYHTKPDKPNLPNQIFETKPTTKTNQIKPNIWNWHVVWL